jgi:DNA-directed RNA polymerase subunit F
MRKSVQEIRDFFQQANEETIKEFLKLIYLAQAAAYVDHLVSRLQNDQLRKFCAEKIVGITPQDMEELKKVKESYEREINNLTKDKRPFTLSSTDKRKVLIKLLLALTTAGGIILGGMATFKHLKNKKETTG